MLPAVCSAPSCGKPAIAVLHAYHLCSAHCDELAEHAQKLNQRLEHMIESWIAQGRGGIR